VGVPGESESFEASGEERYDLEVTRAHNCTCNPDEPHYDCPACSMFRDALQIRRLITIRRNRQIYILEEEKLKPPKS
jgi:hypothetical protein